MRISGSKMHVLRALQAGRSMRVVRESPAPGLHGLGEMPGSIPSASGSPAPTGTIIRGDSIVVRTVELQRRLMAIGYGIGPTGADGIYGPGTALALGKFVRERGGDLGRDWASTGSIDGHSVTLRPVGLYTLLSVVSEGARISLMTARTGPSTGAAASGGSSLDARDMTPALPAGGVTSPGLGWVGVLLAGLGVVGIGAAIWLGVKK